MHDHNTCAFCYLHFHIDWQYDGKQFQDVNDIILFQDVRTVSVHDALTVYDALNVLSSH